MAEMTSRERVLAALDHRETDRIPIAMVCGGINPPAMRELDVFLRKSRELDAKRYIDSFLDVDEVWVTGDFGQELDMWEEFIKPYHVRINEMIHDMGAKVIYHTDGAISEAVPGLMDMGIDVLQALQFSAAGMDPQHLKDNYGRNLCFEGGMCVQKVLPFGTVEEVKEECRKLISVLGKKGGYLCGPSHFIQAGAPAENIAAFFDEATEYYPYQP